MHSLEQVAFALEELRERVEAIEALILDLDPTSPPLLKKSKVDEDD